jgi:uncharacterized repeat protein (TIGR03943 family)
MTSSNLPTHRPQGLFLAALDILALLAWGFLLFRYWLTGLLKLLIHPNYFSLILVSSLLLLALGGIKIGQLFQKSAPGDTIQHITLLPKAWGSGLLLISALAGFLISPSILTSQMALQRGVSETLPVTRSLAQNFRATVKPEERSLIEWVRTLDAYPEPDAYTGQKVKVTGFVINLPQLNDNYLLLGRFIITCCAVDAYPVGLPVKLEASRSAYPADSWLEITGEMATELLNLDTQKVQGVPLQKRQLVIVAKTVKPIPPPADPYGY